MTYLFVILGAAIMASIVIYRAYYAGEKQERMRHAERIQKAALRAMHIRRRVLSDPDFRQRMRKKYK